jgi:hypothetical protein
MADDVEVKIKLEAENLVNMIKVLVAGLNKSEEATEEFIKKIKELNSQLEDGEIDSEHYIKRLSSLSTTLGKVAKAARESTKAVQEQTQAKSAFKDAVDGVTKGIKGSTKATKDEEPVFERYVRRHRWMQSYLLVTGNFMMKLGNGIKAFGAILQLVSAPMVYFLNMVLIPIIPYAAELSGVLFDVVGYLDDIMTEREKGAIGTGLLLLFSAGTILLIADWTQKIGLATAALLGFNSAAAATPAELAMVEGGAAGGAAAGTGFWATAGTMSATAFFGGLAGGIIIGMLVVKDLWDRGTMDLVKIAGENFEKSQPVIMDAMRILFAPLALFGTWVNAAITGSVSNLINNLIIAIKTIAESLVDLVGIVMQPILDTLFGKGTFEKEKSLMGGVYSAITSPVSGFFTSIESGLGGKTVEAFQTGGYVTKTGIASVHAGERITPASGIHGDVGGTYNYNFYGSYKDENDMFRRLMDLMRKEGRRYGV